MTLLRLETLSLSLSVPLLCLRLWGKSRGALLFALLLGDGVGYTFPSWLENSEILTTMVKKIVSAYRDLYPTWNSKLLHQGQDRALLLRMVPSLGLIRILQKWRLRLLLLKCHYWNLKILDCISPLERNWLKQSFPGLVIEFLDRSL